MSTSCQRLVNLQRNPIESLMSQPEAQATLLIDRAERYLIEQDFASALPLLDQAVALEPDNLRAWGSRGLTLGNLKVTTKDLVTSIVC